jgi:hypothetical protein
MKRTKLNVVGTSDIAAIKREIQYVAREIVIARDGGCILRDLHYDGIPECNGYAKNGQLVLQADHLITRGNAATFADTRLIVCICKGHHGWKSLGSKRTQAGVRRARPQPHFAGARQALGCMRARFMEAE